MTKFEITVAAAEARERRNIVTASSPTIAARFNMNLADSCEEPEQMIALSKATGSLTGLVLAAEGISQ
jgi:hypothetical protein